MLKLKHEIRSAITAGNKVIHHFFSVDLAYGVPFVKILYLTDLAQKLLSLRIFSYLHAEIAISAHIYLSLRRDSYLCAEIAISVRI